MAHRLKFDQVGEGTVLIPDGSNLCLPAGVPVSVQRDEDGDLYVHCSSGRHYLCADSDFSDGADWPEYLLGYTVKS